MGAHFPNLLRCLKFNGPKKGSIVTSNIVMQPVPYGLIMCNLAMMGCGEASIDHIGDGMRVSQGGEYTEASLGWRQRPSPRESSDSQACKMRPLTNGHYSRWMTGPATFKHANNSVCPWFHYRI